MYQRKGKVLAIEFTCPTTIEVGDVAVLATADNTVAKVSTEGSLKRVGTVATHQDGATTCVVETSFRERRDDRIAATVFANGPFVWDATGKAASYVQGTIASVTGTEAGPFTFTATAATPAVGTATETFDFEAAAGGTVTGTEAGDFQIRDTMSTSAIGSANEPFTFTASDDQLKVIVDGGAPQTLTLTGAAQTAAQVATQIEAGTTGLTAVAYQDGVEIYATDPTHDWSLEAVANDCYTVLGLSAGTYASVEGTNTIVLAAGANPDETITLTSGTRTVQDVCDDINAGSSFVTATPSTDYVVIVADTATDDLVIKACDKDAYTVLGIAADTYEATVGNDTLVLNVDGEASQTFTLTGSGRTAAQVAAQISGTGFTATAEDGSLVLTADDPESDLEIEACDNDCYTELGLAVNTYVSVPGDNRLLIAITGGGESGGADQPFELTAGERTATQVAQEINLTAEDFEASNVDNHVVLTASQIGDDIVIKASDADAYTILGYTTGTTAGDVANYSAAAIAGVKISGPELCSVQSVIEAPYNIGASSNKLKLNIGSGVSQTFTLSTDTAALPHELADTINATASGFTASSTGAYLVLTADNPGDDIEIETISNSCYSVVGLTVGTTAAPMTINTLEK